VDVLQGLQEVEDAVSKGASVPAFSAQQFASSCFQSETESWHGHQLGI
jgi:hypothetical protein